MRYDGRKLLPDVDEACEAVAGRITLVSEASTQRQSPFSSATSSNQPNAGRPNGASSPHHDTREWRVVPPPRVRAARATRPTRRRTHRRPPHRSTNTRRRHPHIAVTASRRTQSATASQAASRKPISPAPHGLLTVRHGPCLRTRYENGLLAKKEVLSDFSETTSDLVLQPGGGGRI